MPASLRPSRYEPCALRHDDASVSEVVGHILIFGILSMVLILSLVGFNAVKQDTEATAVEARAGMVAQRTATLAVEAALFAEEKPGVRFQGLLPFPYDLEGHSYSIRLEATADRASVVVEVPTILHGPVRAPLFAAQAPGDVVVCDHAPVSGGPVFLVLMPGSASPEPALMAACAAPFDDKTTYLFLQENP
jgi:hypothetical protein